MPNERELWPDDSDPDESELKLSFDDDDESGDDVPKHLRLVPQSAAATTSRQKLEDRIAERKLREELSDWDDWHE